MKAPAIEVRSLTKTYPSFRLREVTFSVPAGQITGFIGRNGAGKTTTLKALLNIVRPEGGSISILGMDMATRELEIRSHIGFVTGGAAYYPRKTLRQLTDVTRSFYPDWDEDLYRRLLARFRLEEGKRVSELSEGMKVKYQLALAMSHGARLLILDEPTSGLDPVSRDELLELFRDLAEGDGVSVLFSTHITSDLEVCAQHIVYIQNGQILADQPLADFSRAYVLVEGTPEQLTPALEGALVGMKKHRADFSGLLRKEDKALAAGCKASSPDLQTLMVYLEREAEA